MLAKAHYGSSIPGLLFLQYSDFFITPFYIFILYRFMKFLKEKAFADNPNRGKILMRAFWLKIFGSLAISLIYEFYFEGGDMESYFWGAQGFYKAFYNDPIIFFKLLFSSAKDIGNLSLTTDIGQRTIPYVYSRHYLSTPEFTTIKISAIFSIFSFFTFTTNSIFFSMFSFWGSWKLFELVSELYPKLENSFAIACFYTPSIFFWGSGLLKDPLTLGALCIVVYYTYKIFVQFRFSLLRLFTLFFFGLLILQIKPYIFLCALPALMLLIFFSYIKKINLPLIKALIFPILLISFVFLSYIMANSLKEQMGKYAIENLTSTMTQFQEWHYYEKQLNDASVYSLGSMDYSTFGILKKFPLAVNVTLFRPYIWEARKPILLLTAIESLWILLLTLRTFYRVGVISFFRIVIQEPILIFCMMFSLIFAFAVGISSYNYGALARYKIPCMSFYLAAIYIIDYIGYSKKIMVNSEKLTELESLPKSV